MKTDDGSNESLRQSETLLSSALQIEPDNANAKILLGYVYAHQHRFEKAEELFTQVAATNPPNAWLWFTGGRCTTCNTRMTRRLRSTAKPLHAR